MLRIWIIIIIAGVILYVLFKSRKPRYYDAPYSESAMDILKKRYAKGEISKEEFEKMKNDLRS
ncbi:MAG: SHOCT domain-containing protein [Desulfobacterales bacterium]|jgi:putative membrane protein|nr:SHOCT domain-containing protein [Desulfobacterales bacterium]